MKEGTWYGDRWFGGKRGRPWTRHWMSFKDASAHLITDPRQWNMHISDKPGVLSNTIKCKIRSALLLLFSSGSFDCVTSPVVTFGRHATFRNVPPNQLTSNFCQRAEQTNWAGVGGGGLCSRPVLCSRSRMVNLSWRDSSWQQHSLGHEHKLPDLRNQPIVSRPVAVIKIHRNHIKSHPKISRRSTAWSQSQRWDLKVKVGDTRPDKSCET